jgi:RHS repeat-associated protein
VVSVVDPDGNVREFAYNQAGQVVRTTPAHRAGEEGAAYTVCYDGLGQRIASRTPEGRVVREVRDELGRVTSRTHEPADLYGSTDVSYVYDDAEVANAAGRLTAVLGDSATWQVGAYDPNGNATSVAITTHLGEAASPWRDGTFTSGAVFDELGRAVAETLPFDPGLMAQPTELVYSYDDRGLPREVRTEGAALLSIGEYSAAGSLVHAGYRNGVTDEWAYEPLTLRLSSSVTRQPGGAAILSYTYAYDPNDNPTTITRTDGPEPLGPSAITKSFGYDSLDRLEWARYEGLSEMPLRYGYAYSAGGNLLVKDDAFYHYDGEDPQAVTGRISLLKGGFESYAYDRDGHMTSASTGEEAWSYTWDGEGRLVSAVPAQGATVSFRYGPNGERLSKRSEWAGEGTADLYLGALELRGSDAQDGGEVAGYTTVSLGAVTVQLALRRDADGRLVRDPAADRTYHKDHLGSTVLVTASDGSITSQTGDAGRLEYAPYGEELLTDEGARRIRQRYTGKETDDETGLTYYGARYISHRLARWASRDPRVLGDAEVALLDEQDANLYAFVAHRPTTLTDPDGLCPNCCFGRACDSVSAETATKHPGAYVTPRMVEEILDDAQTAVDTISLADQTPASNIVSMGISIARRDWKGAALAGLAALATLTVVGDEAIEVTRLGRSLDTGSDTAKLVDKTTEATKVAEGGAYKGLRGGADRHHMPADSVSPLSRADGPAIRMSPSDHRQTASWGTSASAKQYRVYQQQLINEGRIGEALMMDIIDIRNKFGPKYETAIQQVTEYARSLGWW